MPMLSEQEQFDEVYNENDFAIDEMEFGEEMKDP